MIFDGSGEVQPGIEEACNSGVVLCEDMDDCLQTEYIWGILMTELFNGGGTGITSDDNSLIFELLPLLSNHCLSQEVFFCLPWLFPVPLLWRLPITFGRGIMNEIWVCGGVVCLLFFLLMDNKRWDPIFWRGNCIHVFISVAEIKLITSFLSQYNPN